MGKTLSYAFELTGAVAGSFKNAVTSSRSQIAGLGADVRAMEKSSTGQLGASFVTSSQKLAGLSAELKTARTTLATLKNQAAAAGGASDLLARQIAQAEKRVASLTNANKAAVTSHRNLAAAITTEAGSVGKLMKDYAGLSAQMEKTRAKQKALSANLAAQDANKARRGELRASIFDTVALAATVALPVKMAVDFESAMADAAKTIEGMRDDTGKLTPMYFAMVQEAKKLGRELPLSHSQIASIMAAAGQQGITDAKKIAEFTRDAAKMAVAFGISNDEAAAAIGGYRTALGLAQKDVREMLDLMNYFANTSSATEAGIADIVRRVGALGGVAGVSHKPLAALAATLDSMKIAPEVAATGIQNLMLAMNQGSAATKKQREVLANLGLEATELARRMQTDATGAILDFLRAVQKLPEHEQAATLTRYFGRESVKSIAPLLTQLDLLEQNFRQAGDASKYAGSMEKEFANRSATTAGALQRTKNKAAELAINFGSVLLPSINSLLDVAGAAASTLADLSERFPVLSKVIGTAAAATIGLAVTSKTLAYGYTFVKSGLLLAHGAYLRLTGAQVANAATTGTVTLATRAATLAQIAGTAATNAAAIGQRAFAAASVATSTAVKAVTAGTRIMTAALMSSPIGLVVGGIALAAGAVIANWDKVAPFLVGVVDTITGAFSSAWNFITSSAESVFNWLGEKFKWFSDAVDGVQGAWDYFFGDDEKPESKPASETGPGASPPPAVAPPVFDPPANRPVETGPSYPATASSPAGYTPPVPHAPHTGSAGQGQNATSITVPMYFEISGLDEATFRRKMESCRPDIERIVKRVVADMEHHQKRVSFSHGD